jgi:hypothetical protein
MPERDYLQIQKKTLAEISDKLHSKAETKQKIWHNLQAYFEILKAEAQKITEEVKKCTSDCQPAVSVGYLDNPPFEFRLNTGGDTLVALMQSNVISLPEWHHLLARKSFPKSIPYLGQILLYNFMEDSFRYGRLSDPGYLVGRIFINVENQIFVEGERNLHYVFGTKPVKADASTAKTILLKSIVAMIDNDLIAPQYPEIQLITLEQKEDFTLSESRGQKIGFRNQWQETD